MTLDLRGYLPAVRLAAAGVVSMVVGALLWPVRVVDEALFVESVDE